MNKSTTTEMAVKPSYSHVTKPAYETRTSWVNTRGFTVDPTFIKTDTPFLLDTQLHTIKDTTQ